VKAFAIAHVQLIDLIMLRHDLLGTKAASVMRRPRVVCNAEIGIATLADGVGHLF
jgi:hypothetical protein